MKRIADLFCGAGGTSTGAIRAAKRLGHPIDMLAVNHWHTAVRTHELNHPSVRHLCADLNSLDPLKVSGKLDLLCASPECTHHSVARGGKPCDDQSRASAWHVLHWVDKTQPQAFFFENVKEFQDWGPLDANLRPIKAQKGVLFRSFVSALEGLGYQLRYEVVNAADFGDPTSRKRLIIMGRRGAAVRWPDPTHSKDGSDGKPRWVAAKNVIDWSLKGRSIFEGKKLRPNTLKRILAGLKKFNGPFLVKLYGTSDVSSLDQPLPTVTAQGNHLALCEPDPFLFQLDHTKREAAAMVHSVGKPLPTITSADAWAVAEPYIVHLTHHGERQSHSVDAPMPTVTGAHRGELGLVQPFLIGQQSGAAPRSTNDPVPTIASKGAISLVQPFLCKYYGTGAAVSVDEPLDTVTSKDRFLLVEPEQPAMKMDIRFRMLQPHELAAAMSFPKDYAFVGNREQTVKQIGNAVPVRMAEQFCLAALS